MIDDKLVSPSVRARLPAGWKSVLESAADAEPASLQLDDAEAEAADIAERLADLGLLRVYRARHYRLTAAGRALLPGNVVSEEPKTVQPQHPRLLLALAAVSLGFGALVWLLL